MQSQLCCAEIMLSFTRRALCALYSVGSAGSLAMFFLCMSCSTSSILLGSEKQKDKVLIPLLRVKAPFCRPEVL